MQGCHPVHGRVWLVLKRFGSTNMYMHTMAGQTTVFFVCVFVFAATNRNLNRQIESAKIRNQRVYDMAGCMGGYGGARMKVYLNKQRISISSFKDYMSMYEGMEAPVIFEQIGDRWEVSTAAAVCQDSCFYCCCCVCC